METFSALLCRELTGHPTREAGDLRRYRPHYDVIVMLSAIWEMPCNKTLSIYVKTT